jgi:neutrophil factor 4
MAGRKRTPDMQTLPVRMEIVGVEKRKGISKYYVYVIQVTCRDGSHYTINRRYRQFDELQRLLDQRFPVEAGELNPKERILPTLPGKLYLSRSAVREVTDKRLPLLNSYLQQLFSLPNNIRYDSIVKNFSRQTPQERENNRHDNKGPTGHPSKPIRCLLLCI